MSLTNRDIVLFTRDAVFDGAQTDAARAICARNAFGCYEAAAQSIRDSGYRVTKRVEAQIWDELARIKGFDTPKMAA